MTTFEESPPIETGMELSNSLPIEIIERSDGSIIPVNVVAERGLDRILEGYRASVRFGTMTREVAARSYRRWNPNSLYIPEDF